MCNLLRFKGGHGSAGEASYQQYLAAQGQQESQRRLVMKGYCRTIIGEKDYHQMTIVEYPSPQAFADMGKTDAYAKRNAQLRLAGLEEQYLIPMKPGFLKLGRAPAAPQRPLKRFDSESVWATPNGLVGGAGEGSSEVTSSTQKQAVAFVDDAVIGADSAVVVPLSTQHQTFFDWFVLSRSLNK